MTPRLSLTGTTTGSETRMSEDRTTATPATPEPALAPAPGALWNEFLRRNLLLASLASAGVLRGAEARAEGTSGGRG